MVESDASARNRARRRRRSAITLIVVLLILFGAFWYAYSYYKGSDSAPAVAAPTTSCAAGKPVKVTVNVYNATDRNGLAASTAATIRKRGFTVKSVANDPLNKTVKATAEVRYGPAGAAQAKGVGALVTKPVMVDDKRKNATVDLVLGNAFTGLTSATLPRTGCPAGKG